MVIMRQNRICQISMLVQHLSSGKRGYYPTEMCFAPPALVNLFSSDDHETGVDKLTVASNFFL